MPSLFYEPKVQFNQVKDGRILPLVGGKVGTFYAGTDDPAPTWTDYELTSYNTNPVILDSDGRALIFLNGSYKIVVKDANDVPIYTVDNVNSLDDHDFSGLVADTDDLNSTVTTAFAITGNYSVQLSDRGHTILANCITNPINISLLPVATALNKFKITIKKIDFTVNRVNIVANSGEFIESETVYRLNDFGDSVDMLCDGSSWRVTASHIRGSVVRFGIDEVTYTPTLQQHSQTIWVTTATNPVHVQLPSTVSVGRGYKITIKANIPGNNSVFVDAFGADLIEGQSTYTIVANGASVTFHCVAEEIGWVAISDYSSFASGISGDTKTSFNINQSPEWLLMNDGWQISKSGTTAHYAQDSAHDLFIFLYNTYDNTICPVEGGRISPANAQADWEAGKKLRLPLTASRVIGVAGTGSGLTSRTAGQLIGSENVSLSSINNGPHSDHKLSLEQTHPGQVLGYGSTDYSGGGGGSFGPSSTSQGFNVTSSGNGEAHNNIQPTVFEYHFIHL